MDRRRYILNVRPELWSWIVVAVLLAGCSAEQPDLGGGEFPPILSPEFDIELFFDRQDKKLIEAGKDGYYLFTRGRRDDDIEIYESELSSSVSNEAIKVRLATGRAESSLKDFESEVGFKREGNRDILHQLEERNPNSVFISQWTIDGKSIGADSLDLIQDYQGDLPSKVELVYQSSEDAYIRVIQQVHSDQVYNLDFHFNLSKEDDLITVDFIEMEGFNSVTWGDGETSLLRSWQDDVSLNFTIVVNESTPIQGVIRVPSTHSNISLTSLGYRVKSSIRPFISLFDLQEVELIYTDKDGVEYRSSTIDQLLPHQFRILEIAPFEPNENGNPTYRVNFLFSGLLYNKLLQKALYLPEAVARFAFVAHVR